MEGHSVAIAPVVYAWLPELREQVTIKEVEEEYNSLFAGTTMLYPFLNQFNPPYAFYNPLTDVCAVLAVVPRWDEKIWRGVQGQVQLSAYCLADRYLHQQRAKILGEEALLGGWGHGAIYFRRGVEGGCLSAMFSRSATKNVEEWVPKERQYLRERKEWALDPVWLRTERWERIELVKDSLECLILERKRKAA